MVKTYGELYRQMRFALEPEEGAQASNTARELLALAAGRPAATVMAMQSLYAPEAVIRKAMELVGRVLAGEPLAYILGQWDFYGLCLTVTPDVLIPRDDTAAVVDLALEQRFQLPHNPRILDLCTGSGCIGLALASRMKDARVTLTDLSPKALKVARRNAADLRLTGRVSCFQADVMAPADKFLGQFDLIVSNPPYVTTEEMKTLQRSVRDFEPHMALDGGEDGLDFYRAIAENYTRALKPGGFLALEFGMGQEDQVCRILERFDYEILRLRKDSGNITRAVLAKRKTDNAR